jgi:hypothetical protein
LICGWRGEVLEIVDGRHSLAGLGPACCCDLLPGRRIPGEIAGGRRSVAGWGPACCCPTGDLPLGRIILGEITGGRRSAAGWRPARRNPGEIAAPSSRYRFCKREAAH